MVLRRTITHCWCHCDIMPDQLFERHNLNMIMKEISDNRMNEKSEIQFDLKSLSQPNIPVDLKFDVNDLVDAKENIPKRGIMTAKEIVENISGLRRAGHLGQL